ncbi:Six-hairpin glycosidase [Xylariaceae sp. FL0255]|nr:Six-hairpin glycosidase [Xylariaceae sp. FL0255]
MFVDGLNDGFRTQTYNFTTQSRIESFVMQGGFRWQSIHLLSNASITITNVGLTPVSPGAEQASLAGSFNSSDPIINSVWGLGARAVQEACYEQDTLQSTWQITDQGALIQGQYPAVSAKGNGWSDYTMEFTTMIVQGGTGWRVAGGNMGGYGAYFILTATEPELMADGMTPWARSSLIAGYGFSMVNQVLLTSADPTTISIPMEIHMDTWYTISTAINSTGYLITIDGIEAAFVSTDNYQQYVNTGWGTDSTQTGTFGFGPWLNEQAYVTNVMVTDSSGNNIYSNDMMSNDTLAEYSIASNEYSVCLDGAKRDRSVWIGDFSHTARILGVSTGQYDIVKSMIDYEFAFQLTDTDGAGLVPISSYAGADPAYRDLDWPGLLGETDYQHLFLMMVGDYFSLTSDTATLTQYWSNVQAVVNYILNNWLDPYSGLMAGSGTSYFLAQGTTNATAPTALFAVDLNQLANVATVLGDTATATQYKAISANLTTAINSQLWSDANGFYVESLTELTTGSITATAFVIKSGIANATQAALSIAQLPNFLVNIGYKDTTSTASSNSTQLSPNTQGFLLESLFLAHLNLGINASTVTPAVKTMLTQFWPLMVTQNEYTTGASWEYMLADGTPWAAPFCSHSHPWGGAPTYILTNYVLGVRTEFNETTSTFNWVFDPAWEVAQGLGLSEVSGNVPLPGGGYIEASWSIASNETQPMLSYQVVGNDAVTVVEKVRPAT